MNYFFLSVTEHLPRLEYDDQVFTLNDELPDCSVLLFVIVEGGGFIIIYHSIIGIYDLLV